MKSKELKETITKLKKQSGSHSPSIASLLEHIPDLRIDIDGCFLSNPYATALFLSKFKAILQDDAAMRRMIEYYPSQNNQLAAKLAPLLQINKECIFVGNGAIEAIQAVIHNFFTGKTAIVLPTFSAYYEYIKQPENIVYYLLKKENNFELSVPDYISFIKNNPEIRNIVLINPNNPTGNYISKSEMHEICTALKHLDNILIDESFIHFVNEIPIDVQSGHIELFNQFSNVTIVKSMSKDFGVAGLRLGYAIMQKEKVATLCKFGYLWNISGFGESFINLFVDPAFQKEYQSCRRKYNLERDSFLEELKQIDGITVYPTQSNFALVELLHRSASDFCMDLLAEDQIYVRDCSDKIGIQDAAYVRLAFRSKEENAKIASSIKKFAHVLI